MEEFKFVVLKKYAEFKGRAGRREFWMFFLFNIIISVALTIIDSLLGTKVGNGKGILSSLFSLVIFIPSVAVTVRRLHDTNHSGWWWWFFVLLPIIASVIFFTLAWGSSLTWLWALVLIIIIGWIILIGWLATDSTYGDNKYGSNPKGIPATPTPSVA